MKNVKKGLDQNLILFGSIFNSKIVKGQVLKAEIYVKKNGPLQPTCCRKKMLKD